jgi:hypothetical protein
MGYDAGTTPATANGLFSAGGLDPIAAMAYASTINNAGVISAGNNLQRTVESITDASPAALEPCYASGVGAVTSFDDLVDNHADAAAMSMAEGRVLDQTITSAERTLKKAFFNVEPSLHLGSWRGKCTGAAIAQNEVGIADRPLNQGAPAVGSWQPFDGEQDNTCYFVGIHANASTALAVPAAANEICHMQLDTGLVKLNVETSAVRGAITAIVPDAIAANVPASAPLSSGAWSLDNPYVVFEGTTDYEAPLTLVSSDGVTNYYQAAVYIGEADDYVVHLEIDSVPAANQVNELLVSKWQFEKFISTGVTSLAIRSAPNVIGSGDISSLMNVCTMEEEDQIYMSPAVRAAMRALTRYDAFLTSRGINGPGRALKNAYYVSRTAADLYDPSSAGAEFLLPEFYLFPTAGMTATTKRRVYCNLAKNLKDMLLLLSADDNYAATVGSC